MSDFGTYVAVDCFDDGADRRELLVPQPGSSFFLVVAADAHAEGSYGTDSAGGERPRGLVACREAQSFLPCP